MRNLMAASCIILFAVSSPDALPSSAPSPSEEMFTLKASSSDLIPGNVVRVTLSSRPGAPDVQSIHGTFGGIQIPFYPEKTAWSALLGVPFWKRSLPPRLDVQLEIAGGPRSLSLSFEVPEWAYEAEHVEFQGPQVERLRVGSNKMALNAPDQARVERERQEMKTIYATIVAEKRWNGPFQKPIASVVTSSFGNQRVLNGKSQSLHDGVDFRARTPSPVHASAAGQVVVAKNLYYSGNVIVLEHGYGVFTVYAHLSKIGVKTGRKVKADQVLGLSGATGRVTGPHLHWGAVVNQVKVDPRQLLSAPLVGDL